MKYILISCIKLVFLFIIIWCTETQNWNCAFHLEILQVNELNHNKIISPVNRDCEFEPNFRRNPFGAEAIINKIYNGVLSTYGTAVAQWLRCCATNRKVAGSIPGGVIGIFHWHNPPDRTMALWSTQPLTDEYQENFLEVNAAGAYGWQPYHLPVPLSLNLGTLTSWNPLGHSRPVTGLIYFFRPQDF